MSSISSFISNYQHKTAIDALKKLLLYESDGDKTKLLSLLYRLNIKNHSPISIDQPSFYLSHSDLRNNSSRRRKPKKNDNVRYRNMITVRRISCHDITKRFENKCDVCSLGFQSSPIRDIEKKISNSGDRTRSKVISTYNSSVSSLVSTQLRTTEYDQIKPDVTTETSLTDGNNKSTGHSLRRSTSSFVPHVPLYISSPTTLMSTSSNENIQDLIDQLKTCIDMLSVLLQNKSEDEKPRIYNTKPHSDHLKLTNRDNLICEDITVRQCNSPINQKQRRYPNHLPNLCNDRNNELKRCLLVYCRNRNNNENQGSSYLLLSRSSSSIPNTDQDVRSIAMFSEQDNL